MVRATAWGETAAWAPCLPAATAAAVVGGAAARAASRTSAAADAIGFEARILLAAEVGAASVGRAAGAG